MAWNNSDSAAAGAAPRADRSGKGGGERGASAALPKGIVRGLAAGVIVAAGAGLALWLLMGRGDGNAAARPEKTKGPGMIAEAKPSLPARPRVEKEKPGAALRRRYPELNIPEDWDRPYPPQAYRADGTLKRHSRYVTVYTNKLSKAELPLASRTFPNVAERDIAISLMAEPGDMVVGDYEYGEKFVADFLESLKHPSPEDKDDTEDQKTLRLWVAEAKKELKEAYDRGEDIAKIMNETRTQFKELGLYKAEIEQMVEEARRKSTEENGELTPQDERDLIEAANKMLEERGCNPLELPDTFIEKTTHAFKSQDAHQEESETQEENK